MAFFVRRSLERLLHNLGIEVKKASVLIISPVTRWVLVAKGSPALSNTNRQLWVHFGCFVRVLFREKKRGKKKDMNWKNPESLSGLQKHTRELNGFSCDESKPKHLECFNVCVCHSRVHGKEIDQSNICRLCAWVSLMSAIHVMCRDKSQRKWTV